MCLLSKEADANRCSTATKGGPIPLGHPQPFLFSLGSLEKPLPALPSRSLHLKQGATGSCPTQDLSGGLKIRAPTNTSSLPCVSTPTLSHSLPFAQWEDSSGEQVAVGGNEGADTEEETA